MNQTIIKLSIGILLFVTWVLLVVFKVDGTEDLIAAIKLSLAGLGAYHLNDRTNAPSPADKQSGFANLQLLGLIALSSLLLLTGCASSSVQNQSPQVTYVQACSSYGTAFAVALAARKAGKLSQSQIDTVTLLDAQITPICTGPFPQDPDVKVQQISAAVTTMAIIGIINKEASK